MSNNKCPNLIKIIQSNFHKLSKGQKIIADYIINNYDKAAFMTAASLGEVLNISESTIVRFANSLGYSGYRELQKELQELIKHKLTTVQRITLNDYSNKENALSKVMEKDIDNVKKTIQEIDIKSFNKAIDLILKSRHIYIIGLRSSAFLSGYLSFYLNFIFDNVKLVTEGPNDVFEQLIMADKDDVVIGITYPRYSRRTLEAIDLVKSKGCSIISITDSLLSPAAHRADVSLIARSDMISFVDSLVVPMSLINALIVSLGARKRDDITNYFEDLELIWKKYNVYDENNI